MKEDLEYHVLLIMVHLSVIGAFMKMGHVSNANYIHAVQCHSTVQQACDTIHY